MKLIKFSITNYRSITKAHQINISELTVLIGKNNEGKSNILKALNVAMISLQKHARIGGRNERPFQRVKSEEVYDWERDFPIALQSRKQGTQSIFFLEFGLDDDETEEFKKVTGSQLNGVLPITIKYGKDNKSTIDISKPGKGAKVLSEKSAQIARFISL
jgi:AAA15 family ATPase/GTPase